MLQKQAASSWKINQTASRFYCMYFVNFTSFSRMLHPSSERRRRLFFQREFGLHIYILQLYYIYIMQENINIVPTCFLLIGSLFSLILQKLKFSQKIYLLVHRCKTCCTGYSSSSAILYYSLCLFCYYMFRHAHSSTNFVSMQL